MDPNQIETLITQAADARKSAETADTNWLAYLGNARESALRVAAQMKEQQQLADALKARLQSEIGKLKTEHAKEERELAEVRKQLANERREIGMERQRLLNTIQSLQGKVA
jgi:hypothetical protein